MFENPLGLAAGFDKNAIAVDHWHRLGFGSVEVGTITRYPQPGNPKPRLFRIPEEKALINRMGFNNDGCEAAAQRLSHSNPKTVIGINLGKSKVTELKDAPADYEASFRALLPYGAYFVINVSSPNTPGLRSLQEKGPLIDIIQAIQSVDSTKPLFVKIAPDLEFEAVDEVLQVAHDTKLTGLIATNTTIARDMLKYDPEETGGLSGFPVQKKANEILKHVSSHSSPELTVIGVGGIASGDDLWNKFTLGAHLCQAYTGFIYGGPMFTYTVLSQFVSRMDREGVKSISEIRQK